MEFATIVVPLLALILYDSIKVNCWNVDPNRLEVVRSELQNDDILYSRYVHNGRRASGYLNRARSPRNSMETNSDRYASDNMIRRPRLPRNRYRNSRRLYESLEDPGLFYGSRNFRSDHHKRINDGIYHENEGRMIMRQRGSVTLPYRGVTAVSRPNSTTVFRNTQNRATGHGNNPYDDDNEIPRRESICIKCPAERTLIAKRGRSQVFLQRPDLRECQGSQPPKNIYFKRIYGPKIGSLLPAGSHITVGHIVYNNQTLQLCQLRVNVIVQTCQPLQVSSEILTHCPNGNAWGASCYFRCLKHNSKLSGAQRLICNDDLSWNGPPPTCESKDWCDTPTAPDNGRLDCKTPNEYGDNKSSDQPGSAKDAFPRGTICKAQCNAHFVARQRIAKCIKGVWTSTPACRRNLQRRRLRHPRRSRNPIRL